MAVLVKVAPVFASLALLNLFRLEVGVHLARFLEFGPEALVAVSLIACPLLALGPC